jgi:hypothetical protein
MRGHRTGTARRSREPRVTPGLAPLCSKNLPTAAGMLPAGHRGRPLVRRWPPRSGSEALCAQAGFVAAGGAAPLSAASSTLVPGEVSSVAAAGLRVADPRTGINRPLGRPLFAAAATHAAGSSATPLARADRTEWLPISACGHPAQRGSWTTALGPVPAPAAAYLCSFTSTARPLDRRCADCLAGRIADIAAPRRCFRARLRDAVDVDSALDLLGDSPTTPLSLRHRDAGVLPTWPRRARRGARLATTATGVARASAGPVWHLAC